jgi:nucleotide-binding universal stress UspA family protein
VADEPVACGSCTLTFGDDGAEGSDRAWAWIGAHRWPGWALEVITARDPFPAPADAEHAALEPWEPDAPRPGADDLGFARTTYLTAAADPRVALLRPSDLLVVGPPRPGLFGRAHLGSTAAWLLECPPAPLVVTRSAGPVRSIVFCDDGSEHAAATASALVRLPWLSGVSVVALSVDDRRTRPEQVGTANREALARAGAAVDVVVRRGRPSHEIGAELDRRAPDLVALGTRGLTGLARLRVGSTAGHVARTATCSVLVASTEALSG